MLRAYIALSLIYDSRSLTPPPPWGLDILAKMLHTLFMDYLHRFTHGSTDLSYVTSTAASLLPALGIDLKGHLRFFTSSTTAERSAIWMALKVLVMHPNPCNRQF